jgi:hypothetical protein
MKAQRVSRKKDNKTWCIPSSGYNDNSIEIEIELYEEVTTILNELPENDQLFPKGAPFESHIKFGNKILKIR